MTSIGVAAGRSDTCRTAETSVAASWASSTWVEHSVEQVRGTIGMQTGAASWTSNLRAKLWVAVEESSKVDLGKRLPRIGITAGRNVHLQMLHLGGAG